MIKLFVGLGNPGPEYEDTRHNAGFWFIDALARELKVTPVPERSYHGLVARTSVNGQNVWLLKPQTFMNVSGKSVAALARFSRSSPTRFWWRTTRWTLPLARPSSRRAAHTPATMVCATSMPSWAQPITGVCALAWAIQATRPRW